MPTTLPAKTRYVVDVPNVQEISLYASADLAFWRERLAPEGVAPRNHRGRADLLFLAARLQWMGVWFSELSISVALDADAPAQMFLLQAFNSIPWFAWAERTFFQTPYYAGQTRLGARAPAYLELSLGADMALSAAMRAARAPAWRGEETWEAGILLPRQISRTTKAERCFAARLSGLTELYPFVPTDVLEFSPTPGASIFQWLRDSGCAGREWHVRAAARHAKSATYRAR